MVCSAMVSLNIDDEIRLNPLPVQAFADDIALTSYQLNVITDMLSTAEPLLSQAGLEVKPEKCAVFYGRRSGNNWYKGKRDAIPSICIDNCLLPVYSKNVPYKYLGKSLSLSGEDPSQVEEMVSTYKNLVDLIKNCELPLVLKCSALNNFVLAKVLHHFYNTRLSENALTEMESHLVDVVRELFGLYQSTTRLFIFISRLKGGLGVMSDVYHTTRIAFLVKMLNHEVENFRFIARESLKLDMNKRGVQLIDSDNNFLGYQLNAKGFLHTNTSYGCQSDWPDMVRYARKLNVMITFVNDIATVHANGIALPSRNLQKRLMQLCNERDLQDAEKLSIQGQFLNMANINPKLSNSIFYNWMVDDHLIRFVAKARLSILPTRFTTFIWNRENNPLCPFGCRKTESMAHLLNGCIRTFGNFYSRRHDRVVNIVAVMLKSCCRRIRVMVERNIESVFPMLKDEMKDLIHRRPDICVVDELSKYCQIVEVTVCFDMYLDFARESKMARYGPLVECLKRNGYDAELLVLCIGSLGTVHKDVWSNLKKFSRDKDVLKDVIRDCSISAIIGSNYIWRHRVKKLLS